MLNAEAFVSKLLTFLAISFRLNIKKKWRAIVYELCFSKRC